jgi:hypothetical protein
MKSMLEGLDLSPPRLVYIQEEGQQSFVPLFYAEGLRTALVAALAVIDFEREAANTPLATSDPEGHRQSIIDHHDELVLNLETALEPFKVAGGDAKVGPK